MSRPVSLFLLGLLCVIASARAVASEPVITGTINGWEVCPQEFSFCGGKAWFAGKFVGQVGNKQHASGSFLVGVSHESLNETDGGITNVTGGEWFIVIKQGKQEISGTIQPGGTLAYDLETNSFAVLLTLQVTSGTGLVYFKGTLFHDPFPPEIIGMLCQSQCP
jgi:hypothetical protein